jgi:hypothetical protein
VAAERRRYNGVTYASQIEMRRAMWLDDCVKGGFVEWWIGQPLFRLGIAENTYRPDFLVVDHDQIWVEDVKSVETREFRRNLRLWKRYGPCPLKIVKPNGKMWSVRDIMPDALKRRWTERTVQG